MRTHAAWLAWILGIFLVASCSANSDTPGTGNSNTGGTLGTGGTNATTGGSAGAMACSAGFLKCGLSCVNAQTNFQHCGACNNQCAEGQACTNGACSCAGGLTSCNGVCTQLTSDGANCGACGMACSGGLLCSQSKCSATCATGEEACGASCVVKATDPTNCGFCGNRCGGGQTCSNGVCACEGGRPICNGVCVDTMTDPANCGACGNACPTGQVCTAGKCPGVGTGGAGGTSGSGGSGGGAGGAPPAGRNGCALKPGLISDFEEGATTIPTVVTQDDHAGTWEQFNDKTSTSQMLTIEASGGTADCDKFALHVKGSGYSSWGAGISMNLSGTAEAPKPYNATSHQFTGIRFKAKLGSTHDPKSPVRFNISTPWTEDKANPGGTCSEVAATDNKSALGCYQHAGRFLPIGAGDGELGQTWKTYTYCFDRDLYPLSLPSNLTNEQRNNIGSNMLKVQFQFNQAKDYSGGYNKMYPAFAKSLPFDLWLDDVSFVTGECPNTFTSPSNGSPAKAFPQNAAVGSCMPAANAAKFNAAIAKIYATWTKNFVQGDKIVAPEQSNAVTSEAMGYGMMIAAALGDKAAFDKFYGYVKLQINASTGLMGWKAGDSGSASDGDIDIAYALYMAEKQWPGGYATAASNMATAIKDNDLVDYVVRGGSGFKNAPFNASYFAPAAFRKFGSEFTEAISANYTLVNANVGAGTAGIPTDWANPSNGTPSGAGSAQVTSEIVDGENGAMGYDSARVPWRLGLDVCLGGGNTTALKQIVDFFAPKYDMGNSIDLFKAGWYKKSGLVHPKAVDLQGSYIGPITVGGMAMGNNAMRDRGFRAMLDILESGDYNHTYFPSTVGILTLLMLSGNFPTP